MDAVNSQVDLNAPDDIALGQFEGNPAERRWLAPLTCATHSPDFQGILFND